MRLVDMSEWSFIPETYCKSHTKRRMSDMPKSKEKVLTVSECDWLYAEWNHEKNVGLDPAQISVGSNLKVWWTLNRAGFWKNIYFRMAGRN